MTTIKKQNSVKNIHHQNKAKTNYSNKQVKGTLFGPYGKLKKNICLVKWDRITLSGTLLAELNRSTLLKLGWKEKNNIDGYAQQFKLMRKRKEVAVLIRNEHRGRNSWRLDTSNHLNKSDKEKLTKTAQLIILMQN